MKTVKLTCCQARVLVHLQSQSQISKLKKGPELTTSKFYSFHPPPETEYEFIQELNELHFSFNKTNGQLTTKLFSVVFIYVYCIH